MVARAWLCCVFLQLWASRPAGQLSTSPAWGPGAQVLARRPAGSAPAAVAAGSRSHSSGSRSCCQPPSSGRPGQERPALPGAGHTAGRSTGHRRLAALAARTAVAVWLSPAGLLAAVHRSGQWPPPSAVRRPAAGRRSPAGQSTRPAARSSRSPAAGRPAAAAAEAAAALPGCRSSAGRRWQLPPVAPLPRRSVAAGRSTAGGPAGSAQSYKPLSPPQAAADHILGRPGPLKPAAAAVAAARCSRTPAAGTPAGAGRTAAGWQQQRRRRQAAEQRAAGRTDSPRRPPAADWRWQPPPPAAPAGSRSPRRPAAGRQLPQQGPAAAGSHSPAGPHSPRSPAGSCSLRSSAGLQQR
mmetsp:Transcript_16395/g.45682  ORF Transcript_16395/g.45682 Transcript_16395/m.45682 type:complete len:353 (+) Transcript_16395:237-1295(+)